MRNVIITIFAIFLVNCIANSEELYFPPLPSTEWENTSPKELNWNLSVIDSLYDYLEKGNSKAFILLKDGKIVLEKYFGDFTQDSNWYWASAGKSLTATLTGLAQEEGLLSINDKTSKYLGEGWTSMQSEKEDLITIRHQLTMTTGLDYGVENSDCTDPECLKYKADAGSQWYYHNAPYTLLEKVILEASGENYNQYFFRKLRNKIGMNGAWFKLGDNNVYFSTARSMARFGLLMQGNGNWGNTEVISDKQYLNDMINTSNDLNISYGYLWWLNGKESFMIPGTSKEFSGMLYPNAPKDAYAALGKDGQILCIAPSKGLVWVRMGARPDEQLFISTDFCNQIWQYLNRIMDDGTSVRNESQTLGVSPNPASDYIEIIHHSEGSEIRIYNVLGECVLSTLVNFVDTSAGGGQIRLNIEHLPIGLYFIKIGNYSQKFLVVR